MGHPFKWGFTTTTILARSMPSGRRPPHQALRPGSWVTRTRALHRRPNPFYKRGPTMYMGEAPKAMLTLPVLLTSSTQLPIQSQILKGSVGTAMLITLDVA